jgi:hypothetical protein
MDIDFFFPETVSVEHVGGTVTPNVRAQMEKSHEILLYGDHTVVSVDDVIVHHLQNGAVHRYSVLNVHYQSGHGHLPAITTLTVRKEGSKALGTMAQQHVYNVTGNNSRINVQSTDNSTNSVTESVNPSVQAASCCTRSNPGRSSTEARVVGSGR